MDIIYPDNNIRTVPAQLEDRLNALIGIMSKNDIAGSVNISSHMHIIFNELCVAALEYDRAGTDGGADDVTAVVNYIEKNYFNPVTVDDMIDSIHVSKYHFIRRFRRAMGVTPYSYLTNYRINKSKTLLRTTGRSVAEIAEICGFMDTSNSYRISKSAPDRLRSATGAIFLKAV